MSETTSKSHGQRLAEMRRSSAAGKHGDRRTKRLRSRSARKRHALSDQS